MPDRVSPLAEFEVLLVLAVLHLSEQRRDAYGSAIRDEIERRTGRAVPRGSIYVTLDRLEDKGLLVSREGAPSAARRHRPKRVFKVTAEGVRSARASVAALAKMQRGLEAVLGRLQ
jgi:DNA-binding PadR family transcriptional regulator